VGGTTAGYDQSVFALTLSDEVMLLASPSRHSGLSRALSAAKMADPSASASVRAARRSLHRAGLLARSGWRTYAPTNAADIGQRRKAVSTTLRSAGQATPHEIDLAVLLLTTGTLVGQERIRARRMIINLRADALPPATRWLFETSGEPTLRAFADKLLHDTRPPTEYAPFHENMPAGGAGA
jgi:hypothetical protein